MHIEKQALEALERTKNRTAHPSAQEPNTAPLSTKNIFKIKKTTHKAVLKIFQKRKRYLIIIYTIAH